MAVKVKGAVRDKIQELLGGRNITEKRVEALLEELEQRRAMGTQEPDPDPGLVRESSGTPDPSALEREAIRASIAQLTALVQELRTAKAPETKDAAVEAGRVPTVPPQIDMSSYAKLPRGEWFRSPFGPNIEMKLCDCGNCHAHREGHYFCVVCKKGPNLLQVRNGQVSFAKSYMSPGGYWGVTHYCCSPWCQQQYLAIIGVVAGVNEFLPPANTDQAPGEAPPRIVVPVGME